MSVIKDIFQMIFANSSKMNKIMAVTDEIAKTDMTVLIKGEKSDQHL